ncbi:serine/threonine-protein kinase [Actinoplanes sp. NBC_00393]|uniref:serine/threonine-protein kinase n=1 Tax=Actinoplanes sp. NBC_00393 TaxID=2975953 RepID=UPI002E1C5B0A
MPFPGEMLGDRYRLDDRIAAGGMGEVWRATDTVLGRPVAVKTLLAGYAGDAGFRSRFQHEARAMASLRHGGVAPVYDFGETDEGAYLVMARVDGMPLNHWIAERGPLTADETMSIVAQAARALAAAHAAGIVHRDVKPGNLIIEPDGNVVLVDFGVARSAHSVTLTGAREVVGTALYIAPEQVSKRATGPAADLYALGAVAYHCLAGRPPFLGDNPLAVALQHLEQEPPPLPASVPDSVRELVATAMAKDPAERFPSAVAMASAADTAAATLSAAQAAKSGTPAPHNASRLDASGTGVANAARPDASGTGVANASRLDASRSGVASEGYPATKVDLTPSNGTDDGPSAAAAAAAGIGAIAGNGAGMAAAQGTATPGTTPAHTPRLTSDQSAAGRTDVPGGTGGTGGTGANDGVVHDAGDAGREGTDPPGPTANGGPGSGHGAAVNGVANAGPGTATAGHGAMVGREGSEKAPTAFAAGVAPVGTAGPLEATEPRPVGAVGSAAAAGSVGFAGAAFAGAAGGEAGNDSTALLRAADGPGVAGTGEWGDKPVTGSRDNSRRRLLIVTLGVLLLALAGLGTTIALIDPFGPAEKVAPVVSEPAVNKPALSPKPAKTKENKRDDNAVTRDDSEGEDEEGTATESRAPRSSGPANEPTATQPEEEPETTAPTGETETTTAPETPPASAGTQ